MVLLFEYLIYKKLILIISVLTIKKDFLSIIKYGAIIKYQNLYFVNNFLKRVYFRKKNFIFWAHNPNCIFLFN